MPTIDTTSPISVPSSGLITAGSTRALTVDEQVALHFQEGVKETNKVKAAPEAPKGLLAQKHGNKGQVPWNKGLKLAKGGRRPPTPHTNTKPKRVNRKQYTAMVSNPDPQFAEVRQFKSTFKKGTKYDEGFEAGYQEAIHDMAMILAAQVGRKQL